jgi:protein-disulfide isomerase
MARFLICLLLMWASLPEAMAQSSLAAIRSLDKTSHPRRLYSGWLVPQSHEAVFGSRDAYLQLMYYSHFPCPDVECRRFAKTALEGLSQYQDLVDSGRIAFTFRPVVSDQEQASAALVLTCLPPSLAYPSALEVLVKDEGAPLPTPKDYLTKVREAGASEADYEACTADKKYAEILVAHSSFASDENHLRINHTYTTAALFALGTLITPAEDYLRRMVKTIYSPAQHSRSNLLTTLQPWDTVIGKKDAPSKVVVYFSPDRPVSKRFFETSLQKFIQAYVPSKEAVIILRPYPWTTAGEIASLALACMPNDLKHRFLESIFISQAKWKNIEAEPALLSSFVELGNYLGAPKKALQSCIRNPSTRTRLKSDMARAETELNFVVAPTAFVNGELMPLITLNFGDLQRAMSKAKAQKALNSR